MLSWLLLLALWVPSARQACVTLQQDVKWLSSVASDAGATSFAQLGWNFSTNATSKLFVHDPCEERWPRVGCNATTGCLVGLNLSYLPLLHSQLPPSVFTLSSLQSLDARKSGLTTWSAAARNLPKALNLTRLDLGNNQLSDLPKTLYDTTALTYLDLSSNWISGVLSSAIGNLRRLRYLNLGLNMNPYFQFIAGNLESLPSSLEHLDLALCLFGPSLPSSLFTLTSLSFLDLSVNVMKGTLSSSIGMLSRLQVLNLEANKMTGTIPPISLASLRFINLRQNKFSGRLPLQLLNNALTFLDLTYNSLTSLPTEIGNLHSLGYLSLGYNPSLSSFPSEIFDLTSLESLSLSGLKACPCSLK